MRALSKNNNNHALSQRRSAKLKKLKNAVKKINLCKI